MGEQCSMSSTRASQGSTRLSHRDALLLRKLADSRTASRNACRRPGGCRGRTAASRPSFHTCEKALAHLDMLAARMCATVWLL